MGLFYFRMDCFEDKNQYVFKAHHIVENYEGQEIDPNKFSFVLMFVCERWKILKRSFFVFLRKIIYGHSS
jgi:hypothetical protein